MENIEFEEKVDIDDLVLASELKKLPEMEIHAVKEEPFEGSVYEEEKCTASESAHDRKKQYKLEIEETILKLYEELDREKCENSTADFSQKRSLRISEVVDKLDLSEKIVELESANNKMSCEIISLRAKIVKINEEHKMAMSLNTKTMMGIVKNHDKDYAIYANKEI